MDRNTMTSLVMMEYHLVNNHYPPLRRDMAPACVRAVKAINEGEWDRQIELPEGMRYGDQLAKTAPANVIAAFHHLDSFLDSEVEYPLP